MWQLLGYFEVPPYRYTLIFALLGIGVLGLARALKMSRSRFTSPTVIELWRREAEAAACFRWAMRF